MSKPFIVVGGQVYLNAEMVAEAAVDVKAPIPQVDIVKAVIEGKLAGSNGLELNFKTGEFRLGETDEDRDTKMLADCEKRFSGPGASSAIPFASIGEQAAALATMAAGKECGLLERIEALETKILDLQADMGDREAAELRMAAQIACVEADLSTLR